MKLEPRGTKSPVVSQVAAGIPETQTSLRALQRLTRHLPRSYPQGKLKQLSTFVTNVHSGNGEWAKLGFLTPGVLEPLGACEPGLQGTGMCSILTTRD